MGNEEGGEAKAEAATPKPGCCTRWGNYFTRWGKYMRSKGKDCRRTFQTLPDCAMKLICMTTLLLSDADIAFTYVSFISCAHTQRIPASS